LSKAILAAGVDGGLPVEVITVVSPIFPADIDQNSISLAVCRSGFTGSAFFEGQGFTVVAIITNPGSVPNLATSPWGNWANRIRSVKVNPPHVLVEQFVSEIRSTHEDAIIVHDLPEDIGEEPNNAAQPNCQEVQAIMQDV